MNKFFQAAMTALLLSGLPLKVTANENRKLFVSVVAKDQVNKFIARYEAEKFQLVVTSQPVPKASRSITVNVSAKDEFHITELPFAGQPKLLGEIFRFDRFAGYILPRHPANIVAINSHAHFGATLVSGADIDHPVYASIPMRVRAPRAAPVTIDPALFQKLLSEYSGAVDTTIAGKTVRIKERKSAEGRALAREFLVERYRQLGLAAQITPYTSGSYSGGNVIAMIPGKRDPKKHIIVSSHLDNVGNQGANDDGSGTISVLLIANALAKIPLDFTVLFMAFDQEELGLIGSAAYLNSASVEDLIANFHTDMIGRPTSSQEALVADCDKNTSKDYSELFISTAKALKIPIQVTRTCLGRSDHANFWSSNKPAFLIVESGGYDKDPCYHKTCDVAASQDYPYMAHLSTTLANMILNLKLK